MFIIYVKMRRIQFNCVFYLSEPKKLEGNSIQKKRIINKSIDNQSNPIEFELKKLECLNNTTKQKWKISKRLKVYIKTNQLLSGKIWISNFQSSSK